MIVQLATPQNRIKVILFKKNSDQYKGCGLASECYALATRMDATKMLNH
jgi:hypothetical protein